MNGLDVEQVKLAGKPKVEKVIRTDKVIRYPTEARSFQNAIDMCVAGDRIAILPGVYSESAVINVDLEIYREGDKGDVVFVSRHDTTLLVESCKVKLTEIGLCVEEGALMHHALHIDSAEVMLDGCEIFGGLYATFACGDSTLNARQTRFHSAYSFGVSILNSIAHFHDCFIFCNKEDGFNIGGGTSKATFYRSRLSDNKCHGMHVHSGAEVEMDTSEILRNAQSGICISGGDAQFEQRGEGEYKRSFMKIQNSKVKNNEWNAIFVLDASAHIEETDLRKNGRGALTLVCSKSKVQKEIEHRQLPFFDIETYNHEFEETGHVELVGVCPGIREGGQNEFTQPERLPGDWVTYPKERLLELFKSCPMEVQCKLHGHPQGWHPELCKDPQASIKIKAELKNWVQREGGIHAEQEIDCSVADFLKPLGLQKMATRFEDIGCAQVRDMMSMSNIDLINIGIKNPEDRKMLLSRLAVNLDIGAGPKYIKEMNLNALIEATKFQAKRGDKKGTYKEWRKLRDFLLDRVGVGVSGPHLEQKLRELYGEIDVENSAGSEGIDVDELRVGLQRFGINLANVDVEVLIDEAIPQGEESLTYNTFCTICNQVIKS